MAGVAGMGVCVCVGGGAASWCRPVRSKDNWHVANQQRTERRFFFIFIKYTGAAIVGWSQWPIGIIYYNTECSYTF